MSNKKCNRLVAFFHSLTVCTKYANRLQGFADLDLEQTKRTRRCILILRVVRFVYNLVFKLNDLRQICKPTISRLLQTSILFQTIYNTTAKPYIPALSFSYTVAGFP